MARIGVLQLGQVEFGISRLNGSGAALVTAPVTCAHSACHCRSSMTGNRYITTFRKLPTVSPMTNANAINASGDRASSSSTRLADDGTELEDRQVHGDHEPADEYAEHDHDQWFEQARHRIDGIVDFCLVKGRNFRRHFIE